MRRALTAAAMVLICAAVAAGQTPLTGKWQGETGAGATIVLDLTVEGTTLKGTLTRDDQSSPLSEGKVDGQTFSFKATLGGKVEAHGEALADDSDQFNGLVDDVVFRHLD